MSFLAGIYLWLLPITFIPIIFHFLKKRNYKNIKFSTTRFLFDMKEESLKRINLINILLLIIRTLIILFLILMISKPVYNYSSRNISDGSDTMLLILIDDSYSNYNFINNNLSDIIKQIKNTYKNNSTVNIRGFSGQSYLNTSTIKDMKLPLNRISGLYGSYTFSNELLDFEEDINLYLNKDLYIISDLSESIINENNIIDFTSWNVFIYEHNILNHPLIISDLSINENIISNNEIISLFINAENATNNKFDDIEISLFSNDIKVSDNIINFNEKELKRLEFQTSFPDKGIYNCYFKINDYKYYFNLNVDVENNVALVYSNIEDIKYVKNALSAFNDLYENLTVDEFFTSNFLNNNKKFDTIIKFGTEDLENNIISNILLKSSNIIVIPTDNLYLDNLINYFKDIDEYKSEPIYPKNNTILSKKYKSNILLDKIFTNKNTSIDIKKYFEVIPSDNTLLYIDNNHSFLNKYIVNNNRLYLLTVPLDIKSSSLPISGSFIPFLNYLVELNDFDYYAYIDDLIPVNEIYNEQLITHEYNNKEFQYSPGYFKSKSFYLKEPGFHKMYSNNKTIINKSVNVIKDELITIKIKNKTLDSYFNNPIVFQSVDKLKTLLDNIISGLHLWKYLLYIVILLVIVEMYISNIFLYKHND
jgi:hypothetical protein